MWLKTRRNRKSLAPSLHPGCLVIEDDGQQLTAEDIQHLGQRLWRKTAQQHGDGLGLALTANLLKQYGYEFSFQCPTGPMGFALKSSVAGLSVTCKLRNIQPYGCWKIPGQILL